MFRRDAVKTRCTRGGQTIDFIHGRERVGNDMQCSQFFFNCVCAQFQVEKQMFRKQITLSDSDNACDVIEAIRD